MRDTMSCRERERERLVFQFLLISPHPRKTLLFMEIDSQTPKEEDRSRTLEMVGAFIFEKHPGRRRRISVLGN